MGFSVHEGLRLSCKTGGEGLLVEVDDSGINELGTDESGATSDRLERDRFALGGATCSPACDEDSGVCASEGLRSRDEDACDEDNGVCASEGLRSRDEDACDENNGVCASEVLRSRDEDACDEDIGVRASEVLRSRDEDVWDEDNGVRASEVLRSFDMVVVKTGWDA